jgi:hypothetical protein
MLGGFPYAAAHNPCIARLAVVPDLDKELDELYSLPLAEFTQARNDLASRLRQAGQADAAAQVKALKKPTVVAWTVNQLARTHKSDVRKLIRAGERLRKAQTEALSGSSTRLREAQADEREAIRALTADARKLVDNDQTVERVAATLRAAAVDPEALKLVEAGRLTEEVTAAGFGALAGMPVPKAKPRAAPKREDPKQRRRRERIAALRERARELARDADAAEREAQRAQRAAARAREAADRAAAELANAEEE